MGKLPTDTAISVLAELLPKQADSKEVVKLTDKQRKLVKGVARGDSLGKAAREAGYSSTGNASVAMSTIREKFPQLMNRLGLTDESLVNDYLRPGMTAHETEFFQKDGIVTDEREVIAWPIRMRALDMAFNLKGSYAPKPIFGALPEGHEVSIVIKHIGSDNAS